MTTELLSPTDALAHVGPTATGLPEPDEWTLDQALANRRWLWRRKPFPHLVARNVFVPEVYEQIVDAFRMCFEAGPVAYAEQHDFVGGPLTEEAPAPVRFFLSEAWRGLFVRLFAIRSVPHISGGVHRHHPESRNGFPHNDIKTETVLTPDGDNVQCVRAVAILFYLNNVGWQPGDGGGTGLYRHWSEPVEAPEVVAPPIDNSLLAFECSPFSYHSFLRNHRQRDSIVLFLYRRLDDYLQQWGREGLSQYADE